MQRWLIKAKSFVYLTGFMSLVIVHAFWSRIYTCWGHLKNVTFFSFWTCGNFYAKIGFMWTGLLDCEAECGQDGLFDRGSFGDNLPYRKELYWGMSTRYMSTSWEPYKTNFATCSFQFDCLFLPNSILLWLLISIPSIFLDTAWRGHWLIICCKGCSKPCAWIPQQTCDWACFPYPGISANARYFMHLFVSKDCCQLRNLISVGCLPCTAI